MRTLLFVAAALLSAACIPRNNALIQPGNSANTLTARIIIGFSEPGFDYRNPAFLETLSRDLAAKITFLRPLAGNAALYLCESSQSMDILAPRLNKLSEYSMIEYAEPDQKRMLQQRTY